MSATGNAASAPAAPGESGSRPLSWRVRNSSTVLRVPINAPLRDRHGRLSLIDERVMRKPIAKIFNGFGKGGREFVIARCGRFRLGVCHLRYSFVKLPVTQTRQPREAGGTAYTERGKPARQVRVGGLGDEGAIE